MFTKIGGDGSLVVPGGWICTGTNFGGEFDAPEGGNISKPACPGRWKRSVNDP